MIVFFPVMDKKRLEVAALMFTCLYFSGCRSESPAPAAKSSHKETSSHYKEGDKIWFPVLPPWIENTTLEDRYPLKDGLQWEKTGNTQLENKDSQSEYTQYEYVAVKKKHK